MPSTRLRRAVGVALLLSVLGPVGNAQALDPPALLYREGVSESEPLGPWLPLDGAHINGLGFIIGTRGQPKPAGDSGILYRLTALAVPDGHPDQGGAFAAESPCSSNAAGSDREVVLGVGRFEGPGAYTVRLDADVPSNGATRTSCSGGSSSTARFTIDPSPGLDLASARVPPGVEDLVQLARIVPLPAGASGEIHCARNAAVRPDGDVTGLDPVVIFGPAVVRRAIPSGGRWTCAARARVAYPEAPDDWRTTRWGAPVSFDVVSLLGTDVRLLDRRPRKYTIAYVTPPGSEGGLLTLRIAPGKNCPRVRVKTLRARIDEKLTARFTFVLPEKDKASLRNRGGVDAYGWLFRFTFSGTPLVNPGRLTQGGFVNPRRFSGPRTLKLPRDIDFAYCTHTA